MSVASVYARSLYVAATEGSSDGAGILDRLEGELKAAREFLSVSALRVALGAPTTTNEEKEMLVKTLCEKAGYSPLFTKFLTLLVKKGRVSELAQVYQSFREIKLNAVGAVLGRVVSADPMNEDEVRDLSEAFSKKLNQKVYFESSVDSSLLAGLRVTVNGITYDGTLKAQLERLREQLVQAN